MEANPLISIGLPIALFIIMIGMGLSLTPTDFRRVAEQPRAVVVGTLGQLILIPLLGFAVAAVFSSGVLAAGLVLVAVCPGGTTSNLICYLARSNLALSITLTVISSFATIATIPPLVNLGLELFTGEGEVIRLPFMKTLITMSVIVLIPTAIGMAVRGRKPELAKRFEPLISKFSALVLLLIVIAIVWSEWARLPEWLGHSFVPIVALNAAALGASWAIARLSGLAPRDRLTVVIELSLKNTTIGLLIALSLIGNVQLAIPAAIYGLVMYASAFALAAWGRRRFPAPSADPMTAPG